MGTPSHLGHMDRVAATMPSQAHAGAAQEAPDIGHWEGQDVPLVRPSSCNVKGGIPSSRRYLATYLWVRGDAGVGTRHQPHSARSFELALRAVGAARGRPRGRLLPGCGASGVGRSPTPDCPPSGRAAGAHYPLAVGAGGCGHGDPSPTPQRALFGAGLARCEGGTRAPVGGRLLHGCGASGVGRSPTPDCPPSGGAAGAHYPLAVGAGGCGRGDPSPTPQRALLRASFARCGGGMRVPGGAPPAWVWGVRGRALPHPRLPALWAGCRGPLPTGCGCGGVRAWGPVTNPTARALASGLCALWGRHEGARGGASCLGVGRPGSGPLPPPTARPLGGPPGPTTHWLWVRGGAGVGTRHQPHSARSFELALHAVRVARGRPWGGAFCMGVGRPGSGALPPPTARPLGGLPGPTTHWLWVRGVRAWGPVTNPTARALSSWLCALWGRHEGARGGAPPAWVWGVRGRALSHLRLPALWAACRGPPPTGCGCGGMRAWGPVTNPTARALASWLCALWGRHEGAQGVDSCLSGGLRGRVLPHPRLPALWAGCRGPLPTGCGCGGVRAWGPVTNPTARAL